MRIVVFVAAAIACVSLAASTSAQNWVDITPASGPAPTPRALGEAIYDPVNHAMVIFAGQDAGGRTNEVWAFDLTNNTWTDLTPVAGSAPAGRITPTSEYDSDNHTLLTSFGQAQGGGFFNDVWSFDLTTNTWTEHSPPTQPAIRYGVAGAYDPVAKTQVIFAGFTFQGRFEDTQRFDPVADAWTDVTPVTKPLKRCLHAGAYDGLDRLFVIYGGQNGGPLDDIWAFDLVTETWTGYSPSTVPAGRWFCVFEYDITNNRMTMFSGNRGAGGRANDVWVFDMVSKEWLELSPSGGPPAERDGSIGVYVPGEDRMVIFGGATAGGSVNDVWSLENLSDTPTAVRPDVPTRFALHGNAPNPFNPTTRIRYDVPAGGAQLTLRVYDVGGRLIRTLVDGFVGAGAQSELWDGRDDAGTSVASGVYFARLNAASFSQSEKMLLLK